MIAGVAAYSIDERGLWILLVRTSDGRRWTFPKGHVEPGETPVEAAKREAHEEAGLIGDIYESLLCVYLYPSKPDGEPVLAYVMTVEDGPNKLMGVEKGRDPTWCTPDEARERLTDGRAPRWALEHERVLDAAIGWIDKKAP